jgi:hypothetical protein
VLISIKDREYTIDLIVLQGLGIDVILGMNWMSGHRVLINTTTRTIMLREPKGMVLFKCHLAGVLTFRTYIYAI